MSILKELVIKLGLEGATEFNSALEVASKQLNAVRNAVGKLAETIDRGDKFENISRAFEKLTSSRGADPVEYLNKLKDATGGVISAMDLMQRSNVADSLGITKEQFLEVASAAETLGDSMNVDAVPALDSLVEALAKGRDQGIKYLGINADIGAAQKKLSAELKSDLSEEGKLQAARVAIIDAVKRSMVELGGAQDTAQDGVERAQAAWKDLGDELSRALATSPQMTQATANLATAIKNVDVDALVQNITDLVKVAAIATDYIDWLSKAIRDIPKNLAFVEQTKELKSLNEEIGLTQEAVTKLQKTMAMPLAPENMGAMREIGMRVQEESRKKLAEEEAKLNGLMSRRSELFKEHDALVKGTTKSTEAQTKAEAALSTTVVATTNVVNGNVDALVDHTAATKEADKAAEELRKKNVELAKSFKDMDAGVRNSIIVQGLEKQLETAAKNLDTGAFDIALDKMQEALFKGRVEQLVAQYGEAFRKQAEDLAGVEVNEAIKGHSKLLEDSQKEAFQNSVDFFSDILTSVSDDAAFNLEDMLTDALKRVAIGFGATLLAQMTSSFTPGGITSAGGLGQWLASQLFSGASGGGGSDILGSLFSSGASSAGGSYLEGLFGGGGAAASGYGYTDAASGLAVPFESGAFTAAMSWAVPLAVAATTLYIGKDVFDVAQAKGGVDDLSPLSRGQLAVTTGGFSELANLFGIDFGGMSKNAQEQATRREFRTNLQDTGLGQNLEYRGVRGNVSLFDSDYSLQNRTSFTDQAIGFANPLAELFAGGDDKMRSDFAGIFADSLDDVSSYNELILQTQALMEGLGVNTEDVKTQLTQLFLDGKISLDEFTSGVANMNVIAQENLVGQGSVADALALLTDSMTTPRAQLKAIELAFKEMAEIGVDTSTEVASYLTDKFGPDIAGVFAQLASSGIDSWEDIKNASADQIALIFSILAPLRSEIATTFSDAAEQASSSFSEARTSIERDFNSIVNNAKMAGLNVNKALTFKPKVDTSPDDNLAPSEYVR